MAINPDKLNATANGTKPKGFTVNEKNRAKHQVKGNPRATCKATHSNQAPPEPAPTNISTARESALALSTQSHDAMKTLQGEGLQNAAAYVQRKQVERNAVVEKVSDAIAHLTDPDLLEADIMSAAAAKVAARSDAWGYSEPVVDFDNLFALPVSSQRMLNGV